MAKEKNIQIRDNLSNKERIVLGLSEMGGTAILVYLGCLGCVSKIYGGKDLTHEQVSFTFGFAVLVAVQVFGHISGSHINPIVTVAAATLGNIPLIQVPIYFIGQFIGALLGYSLIMISTPEEFLGNYYFNTTGGVLKKSIGICSPAVNPMITPFQAFIVEFLISLILTLVCCGVWDSRNSNKHDSIPIRFGFTITVLAFVGGPFTGANMNPARSFAPAFFNRDWDNHWLYWLGPLLAGFVGAFLYRMVFTKKEPSSKETLHEDLPLNQKP